ncbi:MotA/TolQ/ExbB proton channel family protein [Paraburkholderia sp. J94]|uniref:MotA/TolQ/ExbB proton channel family protein n=1 Tax=Paraburkholderia sp. J94 TaxID=2805441 RepID=UPI002AB169D2|nr:MotA/TolQ/ExbB proton channel family protein [Paraburkholderia sp. J94]
MPASGIMHLWTQGDAMTRAVAALLIAMSVASWSVMAMKAVELAALRRRAVFARAGFWRASAMRESMPRLGRPGSPFFELAAAGQRALTHHASERAPRIDLDDWMQRSLRASIGESAVRLQRGLGVLASIASTAPFVGLLGTVWGIYHALLSLGAGGDASLEHVAGPVGEALVMTALGLCVAIPAVLGHNAFARLARDVVAQLNRFAFALHAQLLSASAPHADAELNDPVRP